MERDKIGKWIGVLLVFLAVLMLSRLSLAQSSTHYAIDFDVISGGGGEMGSTNYLSFGTLGQSSPIGTSASTNYVNHAGFWHAFLGAILEPDISASPNPYDFQRIFLGQSSSRTFTVSNAGTGHLVIGELSLAGDAEYSLPGIDDHCSRAILVPTGICTFQVVFSPGLTSLGKKRATVSIPSNDPESPMTVGIEGRGVRLMVNPEEGTIGSVVEVGGSEFGTKKGKLFVGSAALKVQEWGSGLIKGTLTKALLPSVYEVVVQRKEPKEASPITEPGGFTVKPPEIGEVTPGSGSPLDEITIKGDFFGTKKGKVYLEKDGVKKSCKVTGWTMTEVRFVVPKGLAADSYKLIVENKVGRGEGSFTVK